MVSGCGYWLPGLRQTSVRRIKMLAAICESQSPVSFPDSDIRNHYPPLRGRIRESRFDTWLTSLAVPSEEAIETLRDQYEARIERLQNALDTIDVVDEGDDTPIQQVWALSGRDGLENRTDQLIEEAPDEVVLVIGDESLLTADLVDSLNKVGNGVTLIIGALTEPLEDQIQTKVPDATTFITGLEWLHSENATEDETAIGRLLLIDQSTILVSSIVPGTKEEQAIFGEGFERTCRDRPSAHGPGIVGRSGSSTVITKRLLAQLSLQFDPASLLIGSDPRVVIEGLNSEVD